MNITPERAKELLLVVSLETRGFNESMNLIRDMKWEDLEDKEDCLRNIICLESWESDFKDYEVVLIKGALRELGF